MRPVWNPEIRRTAAQRLLAGGGFEALRLSAIAREAGESKASIGYHFGNKAGLVTALVDSLMHDSNRSLIEETLSVPAGEARVRALIDGEAVTLRFVLASMAILGGIALVILRAPSRRG